MLLETMIYVAVLGVIFTLAVTLLCRSLVNCTALARNADDIVRTLQAGERWRADIRAAAAPITIEVTNNLRVLYIPRQEMKVAYAFWQETVWRSTSLEPAWAPALRSVRASQMLRESANGVVSFRWEVELTAAQPAARLHPWFSFQAVPGGNQ
jgi:hypothetical protein